MSGACHHSGGMVGTMRLGTAHLEWEATVRVESLAAKVWDGHTEEEEEEGPGRAAEYQVVVLGMG